MLPLCLVGGGGEKTIFCPQCLLIVGGCGGWLVIISMVVRTALHLTHSVCHCRSISEYQRPSCYKWTPTLQTRRFFSAQPWATGMSSAQCWIISNYHFAIRTLNMLCMCEWMLANRRSIFASWAVVKISVYAPPAIVTCSHAWKLIIYNWASDQASPFLVVIFIVKMRGFWCHS